MANDTTQETAENEASNKRKADEMSKEAGDAAKKDEDEEAEDEDMGINTPSGKRRFFPRVKHLLTREWEQFLAGVLDALEQSGAPQAAAASHKLSNPWYKAFELVYTGVAQDCSVPHGKNRYHKFKDKIVELWVAMETHAGDDHPLKSRSLEQLEEYRKACANYVATPKKEGMPRTPGVSTSRTPGEKLSATRRSFGAPFALKWRHLDEAAAIKALPEPLQTLVHMRNLSNELGTGNKTALDAQYEKALEAYLKDVPEGKDALVAKSTCLAALSRFAQSDKETKDITAAFEKIVGDYLVAIDENSAMV